MNLHAPLHEIRNDTSDPYSPQLAGPAEDFLLKVIGGIQNPVFVSPFASSS